MGLFRALFGGRTRKIGTVCDVDIPRYMGTWYEIARLPHSFERGMEYVTARYTLKRNGVIEVRNSGIRNGKQVSITGKARAADPGCTGKLSVKFFPFMKSSYRIIALDKEHYDYALVTSSRKSYLWILCRKPVMDENTLIEAVSRARILGFDVKKLIWVRQQ